MVSILQALNNTRQSGRFNSPGTFVSAGEQQQPPLPQQQPPLPPQQYSARRQQQNNVAIPTVEQAEAQTPLKMEEGDVEMKREKPSWMKSNVAGVKKITNKERRRRQNETLRRLLSPKNAIMVLNEMMPQAHISNQFRIEPAAQPNFYARQNTNNFCADLTLNSSSYKGYGDNKLSARNAAAEQAFRDLIIAKMNKFVNDGASVAGEGEKPDDSEAEALPMIQLASFALHKLFTEWECEGHKVPQLKPTNLSVSEDNATVETSAGAGTFGRLLPLNAASMHPCMLLTYMRPSLEYRELHVQGDKPQNIVFTMAVDVDGQTFSGKAGNKKEARRQAAISACGTLFGVQFDEKPLETKPILTAA